MQLRTYLEAKGWLLTFEHPHGPGSPGFDNDINKKIYNKLLTLCRKGTAATYITKAALSNRWEAARYLLDRYECFSKQREKSLRNLVDNLRHVHGTNISRHVDKFEKICGLMAHNNPSKPPTEEEKIDWFLASVTERTYDSVHTSCTDKQLEGTLTFAKVIKLYTHRCFQRYPHFQLDDLDATDSTKPLSNNSNSTVIRSPKGKGKGQGRGEILNNVPIPLVIALELAPPRLVLLAPSPRRAAGKANTLVPAAVPLQTIIANPKRPRNLPVIRAPTVVGPTTTPATATNDKRMKRRNQHLHTNRLINPYLLMNLPSSSLSLFSPSFTPTSTLTTKVMIGGSKHRNKRINKTKTFQKILQPTSWVATTMIK